MKGTGRSKKKEDEVRYEALQAQYAQEWDDWVLWRSMHSTSPARERPAKKQKLVLTLQVQGELKPATKLDFNVTPGMPMAVGLTWTVVDEMAADGAGGRAGRGEQASGSGSSTERVSPLTPEKPAELHLSRERPVQVSGQGLITEAELAAFMTGDEGQSVFDAWSSGGFTSEQVQRLYGQHVLEAFIATQLVLETGTQKG